MTDTFVIITHPFGKRNDVSEILQLVTQFCFHLESNGFNYTRPATTTTTTTMSMAKFSDTHQGEQTASSTAALKSSDTDKVGLATTPTTTIAAVTRRTTEVFDDESTTKEQNITSQTETNPDSK